MSITEDALAQFHALVEKSSNIVFFGGAGVSTESGIPDFRSVDGLYNQKYDYPPEMMLSADFFHSNTEEFYRFYKDKMIVDAKPNNTHLALAKLEELDKLKAVITQNIDGLHQLAGSAIVYELHGSVHRNYCMECNNFYPLDFIKECTSIPYCERCNGLVKPDVVLYGEGLDNSIFSKAHEAIAKADMLIIGGTSLTVYPAAGMVDAYRGDGLVLINKDKTIMDSKANIVLNQPLGEVFSYYL